LTVAAIYVPNPVADISKLPEYEELYSETSIDRDEHPPDWDADGLPGPLRATWHPVTVAPWLSTLIERVSFRPLQLGETEAVGWPSVRTAMVAACPAPQAWLSAVTVTV
jgi:hypothetical protein